MRRRWDAHAPRPGSRRSRGLALAIGLAVASPLSAQAGRVRLEIRPRTGDTLFVRLDQTVEMSGTTRIGAVDSTMRVSTAMQVLSRTIVERGDAGGTQVLAVTDSVALTPAPPSADAERARAAMQGQRVRMRVSADGAMALADGDGASSDVRHLLSQMPASLPREPVAVGSTWTRAMPLPEAADGKHAGALEVQYRLDSLTHGGDLAHISMRGALSRDGAAPGAPRGVHFSTSGTVSGSMLVDRRRGWMTDSRVTFALRTVVTPPKHAARDSGARPMHIKLNITQRLRAR
jgi:hypothetical protein